MKKILSTLTAFALFATLLTGCTKKEDTAQTPEQPAQKTVTVGASPAPHKEILEFVKPLLQEEGITLEIKEFTDYVIPNTALASKELDANFFQHKPFLEEFNEKQKQTLVAKASVHFEPLGIYQGRSQSLADVKDGGEIAIPNDASNRGRALHLLASAGLIKLKEDAGSTATVKDIVENEKNLKFTEVAAEQVAKLLPDVSLGVVNGNYAIAANIRDKALQKESSTSDGAKTYANYLVVREDNQNSQEIEALKKALQSDKVKTFIEETYKGDFVAIFE